MCNYLKDSSFINTVSSRHKRLCVHEKRAHQKNAEHGGNKPYSRHTASKGGKSGEEIQSVSSELLDSSATFSIRYKRQQVVLCFSSRVIFSNVLQNYIANIIDREVSINLFVTFPN